MLILPFVVSGISLLFFVVITIIWQRIPVGVESFSDSDKLFSFSIIVPFRNESKNISKLIESISQLDYPSSSFEVILVNDHSRDDVNSVLSMVENEEFDFKVINLPENLLGKKAAVTLGVSTAKNELIVCTDADCIVNSGWLQSLNKAFRNENRLMIAGPVSFDYRSLFEEIQAVEFAALIAFGASSIQQNRPVMCNGANISYRKWVFNDVNGYEGNEHIPTGDDEFLMHKVHEKYPGKITFIKDPEMIVNTSAKRDFKSLINQRLRWVSKWKLNHRLDIQFLSIFTFFDSLVVYFLVAYSFTDFYAAASLLIVRSFGPYYLLKESSEFFGIRLRPITGIILILFYPIYITLIGIASIFGQYSWKDRKYSVNDK